MKSLNEFFSFNKKKKKNVKKPEKTIQSKVVDGLVLVQPTRFSIGEVLLKGELLGTFKWIEVGPSDEGYNLRVLDKNLYKAMESTSKDLVWKEARFPYFKESKYDEAGAKLPNYDPNKDLENILESFERGLKKVGKY
jgi:hypothetical protein